MRFNVLKRDAFTCQYCGRTPPEVVLHVDHIVPESEGGRDELDNLLTACADCNLGKSAQPLQNLPPGLTRCVVCAEIIRLDDAGGSAGLLVLGHEECEEAWNEALLEKRRLALGDEEREPSEIDLEVAAWDSIASDLGPSEIDLEVAAWDRIARKAGC